MFKKAGGHRDILCLSANKKKKHPKSVGSCNCQPWHTLSTISAAISVICRRRKKGAEANICFSVAAFHRRAEERTQLLPRQKIQLLNFSPLFISDFLLFPSVNPCPSFLSVLSFAFFFFPLPPRELRLTLSLSVWQQTSKVLDMHLLCFFFLSVRSIFFFFFTSQGCNFALSIACTFKEEAEKNRDVI